MAVGKECLYPGHCTFAYCQEEIDVWTLERKGFISRELLFDPYGPNSNVRLTIPKILQEHHGIFMFLCGVSSMTFVTAVVMLSVMPNNSKVFHFIRRREKKKCLSHCKWMFTSKMFLTKKKKKNFRCQDDRWLLLLLYPEHI